MRLFSRIQFAFRRPVRKKPQQGRSRSLVQSLVEATGRIIAEQGLEAATAARIAAQAGVSVGSLYQYFDRKEDLYEALLEQIAEGLKALVRGQIELLPDKNLAAFVRDLLHDVWTYLEANDQRYLHVTRYWAQLDFTRVMNDLERQMHTALAVYVMNHPPRAAVSDLPAKIYVLVNSVLFTIMRYISDPAPHVTREQIIETFAAMAAGVIGIDEAPRRRKIR